MIKARPQYASQLDFVQINDFDDISDNSQPNIFSEAVKGVDGIIHTASVSLCPQQAPGYLGN